jgi:hypothetical protein
MINNEMAVKMTNEVLDNWKEEAMQKAKDFCETEIDKAIRNKVAEGSFLVKVVVPVHIEIVYVLTIVQDLGFKVHKIGTNGLEIRWQKQGE